MLSRKIRAMVSFVLSIMAVCVVQEKAAAAAASTSRAGGFEEYEPLVIAFIAPAVMADAILAYIKEPPRSWQQSLAILPRSRHILSNTEMRNLMAHLNALPEFADVVANKCGARMEVVGPGAMLYTEAATITCLVHSKVCLRRECSRWARRCV